MSANVNTQVKRKQKWVFKPWVRITWFTIQLIIGFYVMWGLLWMCAAIEHI